MAVLPANRLIEDIERRVTCRPGPVIVYWYTVMDRREEYGRAIHECGSPHCIIPLIPRRAGLFEAPNALLSDLVQVIDEHRGVIESMAAERWPIGEPLVLLILSRSPLAVPGGCSPAALPAWFPRVGGTLAEVEIQDLTFVADTPLNCPEARIASLCESLFALELGLMRRLNEISKNKPRNCQALFSLILKQGETVPDLLAVWEANASAVREPRGFRPSVKEGRSVVARLVGLFSRTTPDKMAATGAATGEALGLEGSRRPPLASILFRPTQPVQNTSAEGGRELLTALFATYQYITAAAHADAYPRYPVSLLEAFSLDLIGALDHFAAALE